LSLLANSSLIVIGLAEGILVGGASAAFFSALGVVARLAQLTKTPSYIHLYGLTIVCGAVSSSLCYFTDTTLILNSFFVALVGLTMGMFIGFLAGALTEVLDVLPIISRNLKIEQYLDWILLFFILGKIAGSLFYWLYPIWPN